MTFFEGNVPFWVCDTEKVSGMKKRESKSAASLPIPSSMNLPLRPWATTAFIVH